MGRMMGRKKAGRAKVNKIRALTPSRGGQGGIRTQGPVRRGQHLRWSVAIRLHGRATYCPKWGNKAAGAGKPNHPQQSCELNGWHKIKLTFLSNVCADGG